MANGTLSANPMRRLNLALLGLATLFLLGMLDQVGWANLGRQFLQVGYYCPLLLIPFGLSNYLGAISWNYLLLTKETRPSLSRLFFLRLRRGVPEPAYPYRIHGR